MSLLIKNVLLEGEQKDLLPEIFYLCTVIQNINRMEVVRKIIRADKLTPIIDLPWASKGLRVEVVVTPLKEISRLKDSEKSLKGYLKAYANPALREKESYAWENNIMEKYAHT